jgi:hypothetical protein
MSVARPTSGVRISELASVARPALACKPFAEPKRDLDSVGLGFDLASVGPLPKEPLNSEPRIPLFEDGTTILVGYAFHRQGRNDQAPLIGRIQSNVRHQRAVLSGSGPCSESSEWKWYDHDSPYPMAAKPWRVGL